MFEKGKMLDDQVMSQESFTEHLENCNAGIARSSLKVGEIRKYDCFIIFIYSNTA